MKKVIILIIICLVLLVGIPSFIMWNKNNVVTTITLDINPSIEINLTKDEKVESIVALNDEAKEIISNDIKGKSLKDTFELLINNLIEQNYIDEENNIDIILYVEGNIKNEEVAKQLEFEFGKKEVHTEIIIIDKITDDDKKLAKEYNVSPAKVSYIKTVIENKENIEIDNLVEKSVNELKETKKSGKYCDEGYMLDGDWCYKEKERIAASNGLICPSGYNEYKGKCYEEVGFIESDKSICREGFKLVDNECISESTYEAFAVCDNGVFHDGYCEIEKYYGDAKEYCRITPGEDLLYNGRCLGRKPTINGKCLNNDKLINGYCYDTSPSSGYKADWVCPDGKFITNPDGSLMYEDKKCYKKTKEKPSSYYCNENDTLDGVKCISKVVEDVRKQIVCPSGYTLVNNDRCINYKKTAKKENGLVCNGENVRLVENTCIIYEKIEAKSY